ncbi:hypothetical protein ACFLZW_06725 [Chloroflexota bacterium]
MKNISKTILLILLASLLLTTTALAAEGYQISWWKVANGGGTIQSEGGQYVLSSTIGQWDAGSATGNGTAFDGGFWAVMRSVLYEFLVYLPFIYR